MKEDGRVVDRWESKLCARQHMRMDKLIRMAQKAGLFPPALDQYREEKSDRSDRGRWANYNTYWDEKTVDAQWRERKRKAGYLKFRK